MDGTPVHPAGSAPFRGVEFFRPGMDDHIYVGPVIGRKRHALALVRGNEMVLSIRPLAYFASAADRDAFVSALEQLVRPVTRDERKPPPWPTPVRPT